MRQEKIWLVGEGDLPMGEGWQWRSDKVRENWKNFRAVNAFIRRADGKLWIPRRSSEKRMFPSCLDISVSGCVDYPESYEEAIQHEALEEVGIDMVKAKTLFLGMLSPFEVPGLSAFMKVWEIYVEDVPGYNKEDFTEYFWLSPDELRERIANGERTKGDLPHVLNAFYPPEA